MRIVLLICVASLLAACSLTGRKAKAVTPTPKPLKEKIVQTDTKEDGKVKAFLGVVAAVSALSTIGLILSTRYVPFGKDLIAPLLGISLCCTTVVLWYWTFKVVVAIGVFGFLGYNAYMAWLRYRANRFGEVIVKASQKSKYLAWESGGKDLAIKEQSKEPWVRPMVDRIKQNLRG